MTIIDVEDCSTELPHDEAAKYVYDDHREGEGYNCDNPDDSDSNSESNWRTDYGDEEDDYTDNDNDSVVDEDDMVQAFNRRGVDDKFDNPYDEESSDDDYYKDKLDQADINIGGLLYAKYKAKLRLKENGFDEDDDDDDDKTKSDSETSNSSDLIVTEKSTDDEQMIE